MNYYDSFDCEISPEEEVLFYDPLFDEIEDDIVINNTVYTVFDEIDDIIEI